VTARERRNRTTRSTARRIAAAFGNVNEIRIATVAGEPAFDQRFDDRPASFDDTRTAWNRCSRPFVELGVPVS
jgi:hypothetical protein